MMMRYSCDIVDKSETFVKKEDKKVNEEDEEVVQKWATDVWIVAGRH